MQSVWDYEKNSQVFPALESDVSTDVLIIGGGMCGVLCAYFLGQAGIDCLLVEADTLCSGVTVNTTAKITAQHGIIYSKLIRKYGPEKAKQYWQANNAALQQYAALCQEIDCDFSRRDSYVYSLDDPHKLRQEAAACNSLGCPVEFVSETALPFPVAGAVRMGSQAQFHPIKFVNHLSRGLNIREHTRVRELVGTTAITSGGTVRANRIIVATHFPILNKHGLYFLKMYQHRSYVLALKNVPLPDGMYVDEAQTGLSLRSYREYLLLGGGSHRTGKHGGGWQELRAFAKRYFPQAEECCR